MLEFKPAHINWTMILPLIIMMATGTLVLVIKMFRLYHRNNLLIIISLAGLIGAGASLINQWGLPIGETCGRLIYRDQFSLVMQLLMIASCFLIILLSESYLREKRAAFGEFYPLAIWATAGAMMMVSTKSFMMLFIGLEVLSISLYILSGLSRQESQSEESALKYFLLGSFASGFLLYGIAFAYGATGGFHFDLLSIAWQINDPITNRLLLFSLALMLIGVLFKAGFFPFYQWAPDVYQGAPTNVTLLMATVAKVAAIGALYRLLEASVISKMIWMPMLVWIAICTMILGNIIALWQKDIKRILAYSSIAHAGYILVALLAHFQFPSFIGLGTTVFYLISYCVMTIAVFAVITLNTKSGIENTKFESLNGLWDRSPFGAFVIFISMISFTGIPPVAGFFGKLFIFNDAVESGLISLAIVLAISSAISVYYYLGIVKATFIKSSTAISSKIKMSKSLSIVCLICLISIFTLSFYTTQISDSVMKNVLNNEFQCTINK